MVKIYSSGQFLAFASRLLRLSIVVTIASICRSTADIDYYMMNVTPDFQLADSPVWMNVTQSVFFIDGTQKMINRYREDISSTHSVKIESEELKFLVPVATDEFVVGYGSGVGVYPWNGESTETIAATNKLSMFDDQTELVNCGKADVVGRLWVGTKRTDSGNGLDVFGRLYSVDADGTVTKRLLNIGVPGGIAWSLDNKKIYYSDMTKKTIFSHSFDEVSGVISNDSLVVFDFIINNIAGIPSGITIDTTGKIWVSCRESSSAFQIDPVAKKLLMTVNFPDSHDITSVVFGSSNLQELYATSNKNLYRVTKTGSTGIGVSAVNVANWPKGGP